MELYSTVCMLSTESGEVVNEYMTVHEASDDTLTPIEDIYKSMTEGIVVNGYAWNRRYIATNKQKSEALSRGKKAVVQIDPESMNAIATYSSVAHATRETRITNIDKAARGMIQLAGGYIWEYVHKTK